MSTDDPCTLATDAPASAVDATIADRPAADPPGSTTAGDVCNASSSRLDRSPGDDPAPDVADGAPLAPGCALGATSDAPQAPMKRRPTADHVLAPTEALTQIAVGIDPTADRLAPPHLLEDDVPSARFAAPSAPRTSRREQTGETGIYTERLRRDAFELSFDVDLDADDLPDLDHNAESGWQYVTGHHPPSLRRFLLFRALPAGLLIAITAWSWMLIRSGDRTAPRPGEDSVETPVDAAETGVDEAATPGPLAPPAESEDSETIAALKLLDSYAESVAANETVGKTQLKHAIAPRKVTVVNLWATWCQPCIHELPFLKEVFRIQGWDDVKFVPLLVFDPKPSRAAFRDNAAKMPPFDHFLADRDLSSGPKAALIADKRLPEKFDLPVTILFDCQRKIHKIYREAFNTPAKFEEFVQDVEALRDKLDSSACRPPVARPDPPLLQSRPQPQISAVPPTPSPAQKAKPTGCGDGFCDRGKETCECAQDCPCSPSEQCKYRADSGSACVPRKPKIGL